MRKWSAWLVLTALVAAAAVTPARAADIQPFTQAAFERAQADGKTILVTIHAEWCPVCKRMKPVEEALLKDRKYKNVAAFLVDYDRQPDALKALKVGSHATQVVFKGAKEVGRHTSITDRAKMEQLLNRASS